MRQRKYTSDLLDSANYINAKPDSATTCKPTSSLHFSTFGSDQTLLDDPSIYRWIVGKLVYLAITRSDITYVVNSLSQHMAQPTKKDLRNAHTILHYIKDSLGLGLFFAGSTTSKSRAFLDSDWASCPSTKWLTMGFSIYLGDSLISWKTKKQRTIARSSTEVKYRALAYTSCKIKWLVSLL